MRSDSLDDLLTNIWALGAGSVRFRAVLLPVGRTFIHPMWSAQDWPDLKAVPGGQKPEGEKEPKVEPEPAPKTQAKPPPGKKAPAKKEEPKRKESGENPHAIVLDRVKIIKGIATEVFLGCIRPGVNLATEYLDPTPQTNPRQRNR